MELSYGITLEQKQQLSQGQIQSLEVLAMDSMELNQFLQNEYLENPLLDYSGDHGTGSVEINKTYEQTTPFEKNYEDMVEEEDRRRKDIPMQDADHVKNYILYQLPRNMYNARQWNLLEYMVECLDDTGFFTTPLKEVAEKTGMSEPEVDLALKTLQELEPYGIFAPDLRHCLMKQLEMQGDRNSTAYRIVEEHLQDVADGKISSISRSMKLSTVEVRKCIEQIARLNPRPMSEFGTEHTGYIVPDIIFHKEHGKWEIELNDGWVEDYHINDYYLKMMKESKDPELSEYFRVKLERIRFVMNSIMQRRQTMMAISEEILRRQEEYLDGKSFLNPMTMTDVAEHIGIHTSTVSRAIKGKYIQYPGGTTVVKNLFSASVTMTDGDVAVGPMQIKEMIKELINGEDKYKPYSDQAIVKILNERNIDISRRAVAKYREELGIKGSFDRRELR